jgi:hypothetical protein
MSYMPCLEAHSVAIDMPSGRASSGQKKAVEEQLDL